MWISYSTFWFALPFLVIYARVFLSQRRSVQQLTLFWRIDLLYHLLGQTDASGLFWDTEPATSSFFVKAHENQWIQVVKIMM